MQTWREKVLRTVLALWVGGLVAIDIVEAPARFRTPGLERKQITAVGRTVFAAFNRYQLLLGAVGIPAALRGPRWRTLSIAGMIATTLAQMAVLRPWMDRLSSMPAFEERDQQNPQQHDALRQAFRSLHRAYAGLDMLKIGLGLPALLFGEPREETR